MRRPIRVVLALLALAAPAFASGASDTLEVFTEHDGTSASVYALTHRFVIVGSEAVRVDGRELRPESDYRLEPDAGTIRLAEPMGPGQRLEVSYSWVPLDLPRDFAALTPQEPTPADSTRMTSLRRDDLSAADRLGQVVGEDLRIGGAKTLSIEVGNNQDAEVEQSLRVSVTGRIGDDVRLTALLSDQNIPLQPEGDTQRLEELDEVLIRVEGPRGSATLGDFVARRSGTAFGDFERRLSGAEGTLNVGEAGARVAGAATRGDFTTVEFLGEEGKQGPYVLAGDGLNPAGVIVAGSERVWLDGRELERGESRDYVMDYSRGELEFTNRVLVTEDSEIAVDYEIAEQPYSRSFVLGEGRWRSAGGAVRWSTGIASELDDKEPQDVVLNDERRAALEGAGDAPVLVPGAVCGLEDGDYVEVDDHFEYAGPDSGTCDVAFTFVGDGAGEYLRDRDLDTGLTFFRFVGDGLGNYTPGLLLSAPRTRTLADTRFEAEGGGFRLEADGAVSREDRNTLSEVDDEDNDGAAGRASLTWKSPEFAKARGPVALETNATFRGESAEFAPLGRTRDAYLGEVWNFTDTTRADETNATVDATLTGGEAWSVGGGFGVLERLGRFRSTRSRGSAAWTEKRWPTARVEMERIRRENDADSLGTVEGALDRTNVVLSGSFGFLRPGATWWREDREDTRGTDRLSGRDQREIAGTMGLGTGRSARLDLRAAHRTTDVVADGNWERDSVARTMEVRAEAEPRRSVRARVSWIRRDLDYEADRPGRDQTTHLTRADLSHEGLEGLLRGEYVYETTSRFFADLGAGPEAADEPTLAVDASARLRVGGRRARGTGENPPLWRVWLSRLRTDTLLRVEEETRAEDRGPIYRLDFSRYRNEDDTVFGKLLIRQEVTLFPDEPVFSVTGRWERIDTQDNRVDPRRTEILTERRVLRARNRLAPRWTLESQGTWQDDARGDLATGEGEFDVRLLELREEMIYQPAPSTRVSGRLVLVSERDDVSDSSIRGRTIGLAMNTSLLRQGRLRLDASWTAPTSAEGTDPASRFRTRNRDELEWRGTLDARLSDSINGSISYSGRRLEGLNATHLARAELRALF